MALKLNKNLFPSGVISLMVINQKKEITNQRLVYVDHQDDFKVDFAWNKQTYHRRDSVSLQLRVTDKNNLPVVGDFSLAVTDDFYVKQDSLKYNSISGYMNLSSHLKGNIENAGYYANAIKDKIKWRNLDNLLLTQGWAIYLQDKIVDTKRKFDFEAEKEFLVKGNVTNAFNKPVIGSGITLFSKKPLLIADSKTDSLGNFYFKDIFPVDTAIFFIQAKNKRDKSFNVGITLEEFSPPIFTKEFMPITPWNVNINTNFQQNVKQQLSLDKNRDLRLNGNILKEVVVTAKKVVKDSKNLNGPGEADLVLDEQAIEKLGKTTLGDLIREKIPGIYIKTSKSGNRFYMVNGKVLHLIIDGVDINFFTPETTDLSRYFDEYLDYYTAEDIKGVELMQTGRFSTAYVSEYLHPMATTFDNAFIEVTTRGNKGPFLKKTPGIYLYKPLAFSLPKQFYSPKYTATEKVDMTDLRSTIFWIPNFSTDINGTAKLSFFTSDNLGSYTVTMEGTDMEGLFGSRQSSIKVMQGK